MGLSLVRDASEIVCCSVLHCVAVCCIVLQCSASGIWDCVWSESIVSGQTVFGQSRSSVCLSICLSICLSVCLYLRVFMCVCVFGQSL